MHLTSLFSCKVYLNVSVKYLQKKIKSTNTN